jgi:hypothetical protein
MLEEFAFKYLDQVVLFVKVYKAVLPVDDLTTISVSVAN